MLELTAAGARCRRSVAKLLGTIALFSFPLVAGGQQLTKVRTIGFLGANSRESQNQWTTAFGTRLHTLGWIEGPNLLIDYRFADGRADRAAEIASEFVRLNVDVIATSGTALALAAKRATSLIPIVFATSADPVGAGLVKSLSHPEGNATGLSVQATDLSGKRIELLREVLPDVRRLAVLSNVAAPTAAHELVEVRASARTLGVELVEEAISSAVDIPAAVNSLRFRADALHVISDPMLFVYGSQINRLALAARLPTLHNFREHVESGGLISYGTNFSQMFRRAAEMVDRILRGAKPGDIPVEQPTTFELVINLQTARALGVEVPPTLLARADAVIE